MREYVSLIELQLYGEEGLGVLTQRIILPFLTICQSEGALDGLW